MKKGAVVVTVELILFVLVVLGLMLVNIFTGFVTVEETQTYSQSLNLIIDEDSQTSFDVEAEVKSITLSGSVSKTGTAKVYVEKNGLRYLVFDSSGLDKGVVGITGFAIINETNQAIENNSIINETINQTLDETQTNETSQKEITINLAYKGGTNFDTDNDGVETVKGAIDFIAEPSFNWDVDSSKLCTRWKVNSKKGITVVCNGAESCCNFVELAPSDANLSSPFIVTYERYDSTYENVISAQVIYADIDNSEVYYSDWSDLSAEFVPEFIPFEDACVETCVLNGFNDSSYILIFEIEDAILNVSEVGYSVEEEQEETVSMAKGDVTIQFVDGDGTPGNPYQITNCTDLQDMRFDLTAHYILINDIDCSMTNPNMPSFEVSGTITPTSAKGNYYYNGDFNELPSYRHGGGGWYIYDGAGCWYISDEINNPKNDYWFGACTGTFSSITDAYSPEGSATGTAIVTALSDWPDGKGFIPIGNLTHKFTGSFDGRNHTITDLFINRSSTDYVGLFGYGEYTNLSNVGLKRFNVTGKDVVGGLVGKIAYSIINRVFIKLNDILGSDYIGGLVGQTGYGVLINNTYANVKVNGSNVIGGLVGHMEYDNLTNSYAIGNVTGTGTDVGGLVGTNNESGITNTFATGNVTGSSNVGGLVGTNRKDIGNSYWNNHSGNPLVCVGNDLGTTDCTAIQNNTPYFYDSSNPPMDSWDFVRVWEERVDNYPILSGFFHMPTMGEFSTEYGSTNFSSVPDLENVANMTLANQYGKIQFPISYGVSADGEDYDTNIEIGDGFVSVNTTGLDSTFNSSATLTINGICPSTIYYGYNTYTTKQQIEDENQICTESTNPSCTNIICTGNGVSFTVSHFTGFASSGSTNLTIWDETDPEGGSQTKYIGDNVTFYADYETNAGAFISGAQCTINFSDGTWNMSEGYQLLWDRNWTKNDSSTDYVADVAVDSNDNIIVFGRGEGLITSTSDDDWRVEKLYPNGTLIWEKNWSSDVIDGDYTYGVAVDSNDSIIMAGRGKNLASGSSGRDWRIEKVDSDGNTIWVRNWSSEGSYSDYPRAVAVDSNDEIIVAGDGYGLVTGSTSFDWHIIKYNSSGDFMWERNWSGPGLSDSDIALDVAVDGSDNIIVVGYGDGLISGSTNNDWHIEKLSSSGNLLWERNWTNNLTAYDGAYGVAIDGSDNIIVVGEAQNLVAGSSFGDWRTEKLDSSGNLLWERNWSGPGSGSDYPVGVVIDSNNNIISVGSGWQLIPGASYDNWHIEKVDSNGNLLWERNWSISSISGEYAKGVAIDSYDNIIIAGEMFLNISNIEYDWHIEKLQQAYTHEREFSSQDIFDYNVTCNKTGYDILIANDSVFIDQINLTIWDDTDSQTKYPYQQIDFFANYSTSATGEIEGANCTINFTDSTANMTWNPSTELYEYTRSFSSSGILSWNVTCSKLGYTTLTVNDTVTVTSPLAGCDYMVDGCRDISTSHTYCLSQDISSSSKCIRIRANDAVLDCKGYNITKTGTKGASWSIGVNMTLGSGKTLKNCNIKFFKYNVWVNNSADAIIENNNIYPFNTTDVSGPCCGAEVDRGYRYAIKARDSTGLTIANNTIDILYISAYDAGISLTNVDNSNFTNNEVRKTSVNNPNYAFNLDNSDNNLIEGNNISKLQYGIFIDSSSNNTILNNNFSGVSYAITNDDVCLNHRIENNTFSGSISNAIRIGWNGYSNNDVVIGNTITGITTSGFVGIAFNKGNNTIIRNNNISNNQGGGTQYAISSYNGNGIHNITIENNILNGNNYGVSGRTLTSSRIINNTIKNNLDYGIYLSESSLGGNLVANNTVQGSGDSTTESGIIVHHSNNNIVKNNIVTGNQIGIDITGWSRRNNLTNNNISSNLRYGIRINPSSPTYGSNIINNSIIGNGYSGIYTNYYMYNSSFADNKIKSNGFSGSSDYLKAGVAVFITSSLTRQRDIIFQNNNISGNNKFGVYLAIQSATYHPDYSPTNFTFKNNYIQGSDYGIYIYGGSNNTFSNNIITDNSQNGIYLSLTNNTLITNNTVSGSGDRNIDIIDSGNLNIKDQPIGNYSFSNSKPVFENTGEVQLKFLEAVTETGDNLSKDIQIESNLIKVNSSKTGFNARANLTFYNTDSLSLTDRAPYRNGTKCPESACTELADNDTYVFNVTGFTNYSVGEDINYLPTQSIPILNSTFGTNLTTENLTAYNVSTYDAEGDSVKNIINWYRDGSSIMVLNMPFENNGSDAGTNDYSGFDNDGTEVGSMVWDSTGGYDGKGAYEFDGLNDYLEIPYIPLTNGFTVLMWFKRTGASGGSISGYHQVIGRLNGYSDFYSNRLLVSDDGTDVRGQAITKTSPAMSINPNEWNHIGFMHDGVSIYTIANGNVSAGTVYGTIASGSSTIRMGMGDDFYVTNGTIDELMIFNYPLSAEQIKALYENRTDMIVSQETYPYGVWQACITPNDGYEDGATNCSNNLTIFNSAPTQDIPILNSTFGTNLTSENLTVYNASTSDAQNDNVKNIINWYKDGKSIALLNVPFEGGSNSTYTKDYSEYGNNGTVTNAVWESAGGYDGKGAYEFNQDGYIQIPYSSTPSLRIRDNYSIEMWVYNKAGSSQYPTLLNRNEYPPACPPTCAGAGLIWIFTEGTDEKDLKFEWVNSSGVQAESFTSALGKDKWTHITFTYDKPTESLKLYINGTQFETTRNLANYIFPFNGDLSIGTYNGIINANYPFNGTIDEVRIYNLTLSAEQVKALYESKTDTIVSQETFPKEVWQACITPTDSYEYGAENCSNNLTILEVPLCPEGMEGSNTTASPCMITNCTELQNMSLMLSNHYALANDINCSDTVNWNSGAGFKPVGDSTNRFRGTLDGRNHTVTDLFINGGSNTGLFGYTENANISNVGLENVNISGGSSVGGLIGNSDGTGNISNSYVTGNVNGDSGVGLLIGYNYGSISNAYSIGNVLGTSTYVGGLIGASGGSGSIINSYSIANVSGFEAGGLVGATEVDIINSYATGNVSGSTIGGLLGSLYSGKINNSYWNNHTGNPSVGVGSGTDSTTAIQDNEEYFFDAEHVAPMDQWDFENIWEHGSYPVLQWQGTGHPSAAGSGSQADPFNITDCYELQTMKDNLTAYYQLMNDINCSNTINWNLGASFGSGFMPVGNQTTSYSFNGSFEGNNYTITSLFINSSENVGLFGYTGTGAIIRNVGLEETDIIVNTQDSGQYTGALVGTNYGLVEECYSTGSVNVSLSGTGFAVGGLVGKNLGLINNTYSIMEVIGDDAVGGLVGLNDVGGNITNSYALGNVTEGPQFRDGYSIGGLVGENNGRIINSYASNIVNAGGTTRVGGLSGDNDGVITNSYWNNMTGNLNVLACVNGGTGSTSCTTIQDNKRHFFNTNNEPLTSWEYPPWDSFCDKRGYTPLAWENKTNTTACMSYTPNSAPTQVNVMVNSTFGTNYTSENLTCWAKATDIDGDELAYNGSWYRNGVQNLTFSTINYTQGIWINVSTINSSMTYIGDNWSCEVGPYDGVNYSSNLMSINLTVLDGAAPVFINPSNTSTNFKKYSNFTANITITNYDLSNYIFSTNASGGWVNETVIISGAEYNASESRNITINGSNTVCWHYWANDTSGNSDRSIDYCFIVANTAPIALNATINSTDLLNRTNGTLTGSWDFYDIDEESQSDYETKWFNNTIEVTDLRNLTSINPENTTKNENWIFSVRVFDGNDWSGWVNSSVLSIVNAVPSEPSVIINSTFGTNHTTENLTCYASATDIDSDQVIYNGSWYKNGIQNITFTTGSYQQGIPINVSTISSSKTSIGDNWSCEVGSYDGVNYTSHVASNNLTILNRIPTLSTPTLNSTLGNNYTTENLTCYASATDIDGDSISYNGSWYRNGIQNLTFTTGYYTQGIWINVSTISSQDTSIGDNWSCKVRAYDNYNYSSYIMSNNLTILGLLMSLSIELVEPTVKANFTQNEFSEFTVNVSCDLIGDCGEVNVVLDPKQNVELEPKQENPIISFLKGLLNKIINFSTRGITGFATSIYSEGVYIQTAYGEFGTEYGSTNFPEEPDLSNLAGMVLATQYGSISFPSSTSVNASSEDYDANVEIGSRFITVNTSALDGTFNSSATLTINNVKCPAAIFYGGGFYTSADDIINERTTCNSGTDPSCTNIDCNSNTITFDVNHFSGYSVQAAAIPKNGTIPMNSGNPFWTSTNNPYLLNLSAGQSRLITFYVNATGDVGLEYEFFAYVNKTGSSAYNETERVNITIVEAIIASFCGDGSCNGAETCSTCSADCGACGGGGGGCSDPWSCTSWNDCQPDETQTRSCTCGCSNDADCTGDNSEEQSCTYELEGCTDPDADNYNPSANVDDDSCIFDVLGCIDEGAVNFNFDATIDDGSCEYEGCTDESAVNYDITATIDDGSCKYEDIEGCTDEDATNYNEDATIDDDSCEYTLQTTPEVEEPRLAPGMGAREKLEYSIPCVNVTYTEEPEPVKLSLVATIDPRLIPRGYELVVDPFNLECTTDKLGITISIPEHFTDVKALKCTGNRCSPTELTSVTALKCGDTIVQELKRTTETLNPRALPIQITEVEADISSLTEALKSGDSSIRFKGELLEGLKAKLSMPTTPIKEAANPSLQITGTPLVLTLENAKQGISTEVTVPYIESSKFEPGSYSIYVKYDDSWEYVGGKIDESSKTISATIENIANYLDENNQVVFAAMGILCTNCLNTTFELVYEPKLRSRNAILLVHGLASSPSIYDDVVNDIRLTEQPFKTYAFGYPSTKTVDENADELIRQLQLHSNEFDNLYIVGHSLGGLISQQALHKSNLEKQKYSYLDKIRKVVLIGVPNEGTPIVQTFENLFRSLVNAKTGPKIFNINAKIIDDLVEGRITPRLPNVEYYVVAGTKAYEFNKLLLTERYGKTDGLVPVTSAQNIGGNYISDQCKDYWELDVTHTNLINNDISRKLIEKIIAREILFAQDVVQLGSQKFFDVHVTGCNAADTYIVIGKRIEIEEVEDLTGCSCGNGVCGVGENEMNCPSDCAFITSPKNILSLAVFVLLGALLMVGALKYIVLAKHKRIEFEKSAENIPINVKHEITIPTEKLTLEHVERPTEIRPTPKVIEEAPSGRIENLQKQLETVKSELEHLRYAKEKDKETVKLGLIDEEIRQIRKKGIGRKVERLKGAIPKVEEVKTPARLARLTKEFEDVDSQLDNLRYETTEKGTLTDTKLIEEEITELNRKGIKPKQKIISRRIESKEVETRKIAHLNTKLRMLDSKLQNLGSVKVRKRAALRDMNLVDEEIDELNRNGIRPPRPSPKKVARKPRPETTAVKKLGKQLEELDEQINSLSYREVPPSQRMLDTRLKVIDEEIEKEESEFQKILKRNHMKK